ncbi:MAG: GIY-YIG nuclease family protein [Alistipes sp.]|nr:GIY-YIG nuclease family protein [Alistipes sp.]
METSKNYEIVYLLSNPSMPGIYKIGRTTRNDVSARMNELYTTGVPTRFECIRACRVEDSKRAENMLQRVFEKNRISPDREFFSIEPERAIAIFDYIECDNEDVTDEVQLDMQKNADDNNAIAVIEHAKKTPKLNFKAMEIPVGSQLVFTKESSITVEVADENNQVRYKGELTTLSNVTKKLVGYIVRPTKYWYYKDKNVLEIYNKTFGQNE